MIRKRHLLDFAVAFTLLATAACGDDDGGGTTVVPDPPAAPTGVSASVSAGQIAVTWSAAARAEQYTVQRSAVDAGGTFSTVADDLTATAWTDTNAQVDVTYGYRIVARGEGGTSSPSDPAFATIPAELPAETTLRSNISGVRTLSADTTYTVEGVLLVQDGGELRIPAGTLVLASTQVQPSAIIVRRGGKILSEGTETNPVVFTSANRTDPRAGDWGGIVINGRSICNFPADDCVGEGLAGPYGGTDPADNSGRIVYTRIEYAGFEVSFGNELNALTLNGVGSGTEIHHVQTHAGSDDGFEWFGGTVDAKYLIASDISDDSFDFSTGWHGRGQFWIAQQNPDDGDAGYEVDGNEDDPDSTPWTNPKVYNVTLVGKAMGGTGGTAGESTTGMVLRRGTAGEYGNHIVLGFGTAGVDIDQSQTVARIAADSLSLHHSIIFGNAVDFSTDDDGIDDEGIVMQTGWDNRVVDPQLVRPFDRSNPDFRPASGSPAMTGAATPPNDGWFDTSAAFVGAVGAGGTEWYKAAWTRWGH